MTRFSVGFLDALFGETIEIELPDPKGGIFKRRVTKRWFEKLEKQGLIREVRADMITVRILDPLADGIVIRSWEVGKDIQADMVTRFRDSTSGELYVLIAYTGGRPQHFLLKKLLWEKARDAMDGQISPGELQSILMDLIKQNES